MHPHTTRTLAFAALLAAGAAAHALSVPVTSNADSGAGSFREAIAAANGDALVDSIVFDAGLGTITLDSTVAYTGAQALSIHGADATITGVGDFDLFGSNGGGDLWIGHLTFDGSGQEAIQIDLPSGAVGDVRTSLFRVTISGSAGFGLLIEDQIEESAAGVVLDLLHCAITGNGTASLDTNFDQDGVRVNEGGAGGIRLDVTKSTVTGNAYDGIELDEKGEGDVWASASQSDFVDNGFGYPGDLEDGFDIDEADGGSVWAAVVDGSSTGNAEDGYDFNEEGDGDITVNANGARSSDNGSRGQDVEEAGAGTLSFHAESSRYIDNGGDGVRNSETDAGDLLSRLLRTTISGSGDDGIDAEQSKGEDPVVGRGWLRVQKGSSVTGNAKNFELDNVVKLTK